MLFLFQISKLQYILFTDKYNRKPSHFLMLGEMRVGITVVYCISTMTNLVLGRT